MLRRQWFFTSSALMVAMVLAVMGFGAFPAQGDVPPIRGQAPDAATRKTPNDKLVDVASQVPGFGGKYLSRDQQVLNVYLLDPADKEAVAAELARVYGADYLPPGGINVVPGQYSILDLAEWYDLLRSNVWAIGGITATGISEGKNRLLIRVKKEETREAVEKELDRLGIPRDAVIIEKKCCIEFLSHETLQDKVRPIIAGLKITIDTGITSEKVCIQGFLTERSGEKGLVLNSHCTRI